MNTIKKVLVAMGVVLAAQGVAQAGPIITDWKYTLTSEWVLADFTNSAPTNIPPGTIVPIIPSPSTSATSTKLTWGVSTGQGQSSLEVTNQAPNSNVITYIGGGLPPVSFIAPGTNLTHSNNPITGPSLSSTTLRASLSLTSSLPAPGGLTPPGGLNVLDFFITFTETPNSNFPTPCAVSTSPVPCNDIFVLTNNPFQNQSFLLDGNTYFVNIFPTSPTAVLSVLDNQTCSGTNGAGQPNGCVGFTTREGGQTNLPFGFTVSTEPLTQVPEPGSLALMGLGLMGFAAASRKRKNA